MTPPRAPKKAPRTPDEPAISAARDGQTVAPNELSPVELFAPTMNWLIDEGFIRRQEPRRYESLCQCVPD
ncbi:MAG: hypothetical protein JWN43_2260 [Gammaproteobacteria bacterium]|nr:hypothetical protein [Gammaproteobacteria bacterium]